MDGRRKSRTQVALVARYRSPTVFEFVEEQCFDLSEGGMFIKSLAPAPAGTLLKIECQVGGGTEQIAAVARVVWLREADSPDGPRGMGVKFVKLENGSNDVIAAVLTRASVSVPPPAPATPPVTKSSPPPAAATTAPSPSKPPEAFLQAVVQAPANEALASPAKQTAATTPTPAAPSTSTAARPSNATAPAAPSTSSPATKAILFAVLAIVGLIVFANRGSKDTTPEAMEAAPPAAIDTPVPTPTPTPEVQAPAAIEAAPTPVEAPAAVPVEAPQAAIVAPEPIAPTPEPTAAPIAPPIAPPTTPANTTAGMVYVVNVVTTPRGAVVTANDQRCNAPCSLRFTELVGDVKINAEKAEHNPTATTVNASVGFVERDGAMHKTLYLKLHPEAGVATTTPTNDAPPKDGSPPPPAAEPQ